MSYKDLRGKTFIVTGASSGMGKQVSLLLASQGANIGLLDLHAPDALANEIEKAGGGGGCLAVACNVQNARAVDEAVTTVTTRFGGLHGELRESVKMITLSNKYQVLQIWPGSQRQEKHRLHILR